MSDYTNLIARLDQHDDSLCMNNSVCAEARDALGALQAERDAIEAFIRRLAEWESWQVIPMSSEFEGWTHMLHRTEFCPCHGDEDNACHEGCCDPTSLTASDADVLTRILHPGEPTT